MDWFAAVDIYCERTGPGFWSEPINALTNLSFVLAAIWAYVETRRRNIRDWSLDLAIIMVSTIGIGSFLFHTFATVWAELADVIPIWLFVLWFLILSVHAQTGASSLLRTALATVAVVLGIGVVFWVFQSDVTTDPSTGTPGDGFNGSTQYLPALIAIYVFSLIMFWQRDAARWWTLAGAGVFTLSLGFRTIDISVCAHFPLGTHFLWHILNGVMIALLLQGFIRHLENDQSDRR